MSHPVPYLNNFSLLSKQLNMGCFQRLLVGELMLDEGIHSNQSPWNIYIYIYIYIFCEIRRTGEQEGKGGGDEKRQTYSLLLPIYILITQM